MQQTRSDNGSGSQITEQQFASALSEHQLTPGVQYQLRRRREQALAGQGPRSRAVWQAPRLTFAATGALCAMVAVGWLTFFTPGGSEPGFDLAQLEPMMIEDPLLLEEMELLLWLSEIPDEMVQ